MLSAPVPLAAPAAPRIWSLRRDVLVLVAPLPAKLAPKQLVVTVDGKRLKTPAVVSIGRARAGGHVLVAAVAIPEAGDGAPAPTVRQLTVARPEGQRICGITVPVPLTAAPFEPGVLSGIEPGDRAGMVRQLIEAAGLFFRLFDDGGFAQLVRQFAATVAPVRAGQAMRLGKRLALVPVEAVPEAVESVVVVGGNAVRRNAFRPFAYPVKNGRASVLLVELADAVAGASVDLILFARSAAYRLRLDLAAARPAAELEALLDRASSPGLVSHIFGAAAPYAASDAGLSALLRRLMLAKPRPERHAALSPGAAVAGRLDLAVEAPTGGVFLRGWLFDPLDLVEGITAVSAFGQRRELAGLAHRYRRPELDEAVLQHPLGEPGLCLGFVHTVSTPRPVLPGVGWHLEVKLKDGSVRELVPPPAPLRPEAAREKILSDIRPEYLTPAMIREAIAPTATAFHRACLEGERVRGVHRFGVERQRPTWSVVIPLYRMLDYLRHQFAAFFADPDFRDAELILVLDSPEQEEYLLQVLRGLDLVYGLSVRLVVHRKNFGYAAAVNSGAAQARADRLVLLNSDVLPARPGWLSGLTATLDKDPGVGAVGPKLLFEDDSIQHAGLWFWRDYKGDVRNRHFFKGYAADFPEAAVSRAVPAVTGACILVRRSVFDAVGGITEDYVIGDFEDSDFCLKLRSLGLASWYEAGVELYHFERRSILRHEGYTRTIASEVNRLLHADRWDAEMERAMAEPVPPAAPTADAATARVKAAPKRGAPKRRRVRETA